LNKLKVLQIIDSLNVGGTEVLTVNLANSFLDYGVESYLCSTRQRGELENKINKNVNYIHLGKKYIIDVKALLKLKAFIKKNDICIINVHSTSLFFACCLKLLYPKIKLFWHNHTGANIGLKGVKFKIIKFLSNFITGIINVNKDLDTWSKNKLKHKNTIQLNNFPVFNDLKKKTKLKGVENKRIVCLAALRQEKDHLMLIESFKRVSRLKPEWTLHLVGKDYNDNYSVKIKKTIKDNNLKDVVYLYNICSDIKNILEQSNIGVLSSKSEGLPISLLEYGLAHLPVLVTDVGDCKKVINHKKATVKPENSDIYGKALIEIIENNSLRNEISQTLNNNVVKIYSKEKFIIKIKKLYQNS